MKARTLYMVAGGLGVAALGVLLVTYLGRTEAPPNEDDITPALPTGGRSSDDAYENGKRTTITLVDIGNGKSLREDAAAQFLAMVAHAARDGVELRVSSAFRTMTEQQRLYACYLSKLCNNGNLAAKPGFSTHQGGRSVDLNTGSGITAKLGKVYRWLASNAARYGFKNDVSSEPWHWTYYPAPRLAGFSSFGISPLMVATLLPVVPP